MRSVVETVAEAVNSRERIGLGTDVNRHRSLYIPERVNSVIFCRCLQAFAVNTLCDPFADTTPGALDTLQVISDMFSAIYASYFQSKSTKTKNVLFTKSGSLHFSVFDYCLQFTCLVNDWVQSRSVPSVNKAHSGVRQYAHHSAAICDRMSPTLKSKEVGDFWPKFRGVPLGADPSCWGSGP